MKKSSVIISILVILSLLMFAYALFQKTLADDAKNKVVAAQAEAVKAQEKAEENYKEAEMQRAIAIANEVKAKELEMH